MYAKEDFTLNGLNPNDRKNIEEILYKLSFV